MKRISMIVLTVSMLFALSACGGEKVPTQTARPEVEGMSADSIERAGGAETDEQAFMYDADENTRGSMEELGETASADPEPDTAPEETEQVDMEREPVVTEFVNSANSMYDLDSVSVKPGYVYWEDGCLVAECYVSNGFSYAVYNISVDDLSFSNKEVDIASAAFGDLSGLVIAPYSYAEWTFIFSADCVITEGADLSYLSYEYNTSYNY